MIKYGIIEMEYISLKNEKMADLVKKFGHLERGSTSTSDIFSSLVLHIVSQMFSINAAKTINGRLIEIVGEVTPRSIYDTSETNIRNCGISVRKTTYIKRLAEDVIQGIYDFDQLQNMSDKEVVNYLMRIKGVGEWTAEMIAEFTLGRLDIFSFNDVALKNGIKKAHGYKTLSRQRFERLQRLYSPFSTVASLYYYALNDDR